MKATQQVMTVKNAGVHLSSWPEAQRVQDVKLQKSSDGGTSRCKCSLYGERLRIFAKSKDFAMNTPPDYR